MELREKVVMKGSIKKIVLTMQTRVFCTVLLFSSTLPAQVLEYRHAEIMFAEARQVMKAAKDANADLLAPKGWAKGVDSMKRAESAYLDGREMKRIRVILRNTVSEFQAAEVYARRAVAVFGGALQAREDALRSEGNRVAKTDWDKAEEILKTGASNLEQGFERVAQNAAKEAETLYRSAEFKAVKEFVLADAYALIDKAGEAQAAKYAPKTLKKARDFIDLCEKELKENRQDTDMARILATQARREAQHALYLARAGKSAETNQLTWEELFLASEGSLKRIAGVLNLNLAYEEGFKKSTGEIVAQIEDLSKENRTMRSGIFDAGQIVNLLRERNEELLAQLGDVEVEKTEIARRLEYQAMLDTKYAAVEQLFEGEDVLIFREGNSLRVRLTGLSFATGKSRVETRYYSFLDNVAEAVRSFPKVSLVIEGHTDAVGSDAMNMQMSQDRAENVMFYLNSKLSLDSALIQAVGYGESRPIATNETDEGRAKNRRIAVVIHPRFE